MPSALADRANGSRVLVAALIDAHPAIIDSGAAPANASAIVLAAALAGRTAGRAVSYAAAGGHELV